MVNVPWLLDALVNMTVVNMRDVDCHLDESIYPESKQAQLATAQHLVLFETKVCEAELLGFASYKIIESAPEV